MQKKGSKTFVVVMGLALAGVILLGLQREKLSPVERRIFAERIYLQTSLELWGVYYGHYPENCKDYTASPLYFRHPVNPFTGKPMQCLQSPSPGNYFIQREKPTLLHLIILGLPDSSPVSLKNETLKPLTTDGEKEDRFSIVLAEHLGAAFQGYFNLTGRFPSAPEDLTKVWNPFELNPVSPVDGKPIKELFTWGTLKEFEGVLKGVENPSPPVWKYVASWKDLQLYVYTGKKDKPVAIYPLGIAKALRQTPPSAPKSS